MRFHQLLACIGVAYLLAAGLVSLTGSACAEFDIALAPKVAGQLQAGALAFFGVLLGHGYPTRN